MNKQELLNQKESTQQTLLKAIEKQQTNLTKEERKVVNGAVKVLLAELNYIDGKLKRIETFERLERI